MIFAQFGTFFFLAEDAQFGTAGSTFEKVLKFPPPIFKIPLGGKFKMFVVVLSMNLFSDFFPLHFSSQHSLAFHQKMEKKVISSKRQ